MMTRRIFVKGEIEWSFSDGNEIKRRILGGDLALVLNESLIFMS